MCCAWVSDGLAEEKMEADFSLFHGFHSHSERSSVFLHEKLLSVVSDASVHLSGVVLAAKNIRYVC